MLLKQFAATDPHTVSLTTFAGKPEVISISKLSLFGNIIAIDIAGEFLILSVS